MKQFACFFMLLFCCSFTVNAQVYNWTKTIGSVGYEGGQFVTVDESNGNVYVLGGFQNTIDVDPSAAVYNLVADSTYAFFIAKYTENGTLLWARMANGQINCSGAQVTSAGDLIFAGSYLFNAVFTQPLSIFQLPYVYVESPYIARYTSNGNIIYVKTLGAYSNTLYRVAGFKLDNADNIIFSISGHGGLNLDMSGANLIYFDQDFGILKYDQNGNYLWSKGFGTWPAALFGGNYSQSLDVDMYNNIYVVGQFKGTIDFSGGLATGILVGTSQSIMDYNHFLCKFDSFGNLIFAKNTAEIIYNGTPNLPGNGLYFGSSTILVNATGSEIFVAMQLSDTFNINPNGSPIIFIPTSESDICLLKFDIAGNIVWSKQINSTNGSENVIQMEMDLDGNLYLTGSYTGDIYFNPNSTIGGAISLNSFGLFIAKLDANGNYIWEWKAEHGVGNSIYMDDCENLYGTGAFSNLVNFSPTPGLDIKNSTGSSDAYFLKYSKYRIDLLSQSNPSGCGMQDGTIVLSGFAPNTLNPVFGLQNNLYFSFGNQLADSNGVVTLSGLGVGLYSQIYTLINGCKMYCQAEINLTTPTPNPLFNSLAQPSNCTALDGELSFNGLIPNLVYQITYNYDLNLPNSTSIQTNANGVLILNNLAVGTYFNFEFTALGCSSAVPDTFTVVTQNIGSNIYLTSSNATSCILTDGQIQITGLLSNALYQITYDYNGTLISTSYTSNSAGEITITGLSVGTYTSIQIGIPSCTFTTINNFTITNPPLPASPAVGSHVSFCSTAINPILAPNGTAGIINWYSDSNLNTLVGTGNSFVPPLIFGQNIYYVTATTNDCISTPTAILVTINEQPSLSVAGLPFTTCLTQTNLIATTPQVGVGNWIVNSGGAVVSDNNNPQSAVVLGGGINLLTWEVSNGVCPTSSSQVQITSMPMLANAEILANDNCGKGNGAVLLTQNGGLEPINYVWNGSGFNGNTQSNLIAGNYSIVATDAQGCAANLMFDVPDVNSATFSLGNALQIEQGDSVYFNLPKNGSYLWSPDSTLTCDTCHDPIAFPFVSTEYFVEHIDTNGCFASSKVRVNVDIQCADLFIPTGFSPNNDGNNDEECVHGTCFKSLLFCIYNRWGEKIFETTNTDLCWDGTYKGMPCNEGVYTYFLNATTTKGANFYKRGNITLIK